MDAIGSMREKEVREGMKILNELKLVLTKEAFYIFRKKQRFINGTDTFD